MKLALGTVQFGLDYGISNTEGMTSFDEILKLLDLAKKNGINTLDTAKEYGSSEEILGNCANGFEIVTKIQNPIDFEQSLKKLKRDKLYGLLFHNADVLFKNPEYLKEFEKLKKENKVEKIGVSVYYSEQIDIILENYNIDLIQLPINILDQRLLQSSHLKKLKDKNIEIHVRSIFLQGLLLMKNPPDYFKPIKPILDKINQNKELILGFVKNIDEIDKIVIGVNDSRQLQENIEAYNKDVDIDFSKFSINDTKFIDPSNWEGV